MRGLLGQLREDLLYVAVYGPGFGECTLVRVPPDRWIIIDGCRIRGQSPAIEILSYHGQPWSCVILSHPHEDHVHGIADLLDLEGDGPVGCTDFDLIGETSLGNGSNAAEHLSQGATREALQAIMDHWERFPSRRWMLRRGSSPQSIGAAQLTVLHPDEATVSQFRGRREHLNRLSAPVLVEWQKVRLLLGADVLQQDWPGIAQDHSGLNRRQLLKVPHHASSGALSQAILTGSDRTSVAVATPYNRRWRLPRFEDGEGCANLLQHFNAIHLTGLPYAHDLQGKIPYRVTRQDLRDGLRPPAIGEQLYPGIFAEAYPDSPDVNACWLMTSYDAAGTMVEVEHGPGALLVFDADR